MLSLNKLMPAYKTYEILFGCFGYRLQYVANSKHPASVSVQRMANVVARNK